MIHRYPVNYIAITQKFKSGSHHGLDLGWNSKYCEGKNQPIYASADGTVYSIKDNDATGKSWGNFVKINHGGNEYTLYAHLKTGSLLVKVGDKVKQGQRIATMGTTGESQGNHLHFEIYKGGAGTNYRVDPLPLTYVFDGQIVHNDDKSIVKYYTPITPSVARDTSKDQIKTLKYVNVRAGAGTNQTILGQVDAGNIYKFTETKSSGEYTWYKIAEGQWIAQDKANTYLEVLLKEETQETNNETNAELEELKKQNQELIDGNALLTKQNEDLKQQIEELRQELTETETYKQLFEIEKTAKYKIKLNEGERLYIK